MNAEDMANFQYEWVQSLLDLTTLRDNGITRDTVCKQRRG
jgi:hypothetical protein